MAVRRYQLLSQTAPPPPPPPLFLVWLCQRRRLVLPDRKYGATRFVHPQVGMWKDTIVVYLMYLWIGLRRVRNTKQAHRVASRYRAGRCGPWRSTFPAVREPAARNAWVCLPTHGQIANRKRRVMRRWFCLSLTCQLWKLKFYEFTLKEC
jgi:hypothetical protein